MTSLTTTRHGACTTADCLAELGEYSLDLALRSGQLVEMFPGVLAEYARARDPVTRASAALLWCAPDTVLCGRSAAWLWGCAAARDPVVHVLRGYGRNRRAPDGISVHSGELRVDEVTEREGLPVLSLSRTVADLLCAKDNARGFTIAEEAMRLTAPASRAVIRAEVGAAIGRRADRRYTATAERLCGLLRGVPARLESSALLIAVIDNGFPLPQRDFPIVSAAGSEQYRVEFAWPASRVVLEPQHDQPDRLRDRDLARRGWRLIRADAQDLSREDFGAVLTLAASPAPRRREPRRHAGVS